jgi:hypothetical protein
VNTVNRWNSVQVSHRDVAEYYLVERTFLMQGDLLRRGARCGYQRIDFPVFPNVSAGTHSVHPEFVGSDLMIMRR